MTGEPRDNVVSKLRSPPIAPRRQRPRNLPGIYLLPILAGWAVLGCGSADPEMVPVSGKLIFLERDLPGVCRMTFVPTDDGAGGRRPNGAEMQADGSYAVTEFRGVQGLYPGSYRVRLAYFDLRPGGNPDSEADWRETTYEVPELLQIEAGQSGQQYDITIPSAGGQ